MPGKIEAYLDCASPYSYLALFHLRRVRPQLAQYGVSVEFFPIFLGGINVATGNKPPTTLPARGRYSPYDMKRSVQHYGTVPLSGPSFFPMLSLLPQRCMLVVKDKYDQERFETAYAELWIYVFNKHIDLANVDNMRKCLREHFDEGETEEILKLAATKPYKDRLTSETKRIVEDYGAFGAPWIWMTNGEGKSEPLFGSDRWAYLYRYMGVEFEDVKIVDKSASKPEAKL